MGLSANTNLFRYTTISYYNLELGDVAAFLPNCYCYRAIVRQHPSATSHAVHLAQVQTRSAVYRPTYVAMHKPLHYVLTGSNTVPTASEPVQTTAVSQHAVKVSLNNLSVSTLRQPVKAVPPSLPTHSAAAQQSLSNALDNPA